MYFGSFGDFPPLSITHCLLPPAAFHKAGAGILCEEGQVVYNPGESRRQDKTYSHVLLSRLQASYMNLPFPPRGQ